MVSGASVSALLLAILALAALATWIEYTARRGPPEIAARRVRLPPVAESSPIPRGGAGHPLDVTFRTPSRRALRDTAGIADGLMRIPTALGWGSEQAEKGRCLFSQKREGGAHLLLTVRPGCSRVRSGKRPADVCGRGEGPPWNPGPDRSSRPVSY